MLSLGRHNDKQYGLAFAVSTPIMYANADLVRQAGADPDNLPKTWDGVIKLARKIDALGDNVYGMYFDWSITGNWLWQALVSSNGGTMLTKDEKTVAFDGKAGVKAINLLNDMVTKTNMPNIRECSEFCVTVSVPGSASAPAEVKVRSENGPSISHVGGVDFCWSGVPGTIFSICK
ncbi:MAG: extracellular solute-binding protein [Desulfobacter sp.]|nr:MAG: extracellular solute-binding protein [Desulfobacter sp.]